MGNSLRTAKLQQVKSLIFRGIVVCSLATMLAVSLDMSHGVKSAAAAGYSATTLHKDRRPDRERSVGTSQSRPHIVRR